MGLRATKNERGKFLERKRGEDSEEGEEIERYKKEREIECIRGGDKTWSDWMRKREIDHEWERTWEIGRSSERER